MKLFGPIGKSVSMYTRHQTYMRRDRCGIVHTLYMLMHDTTANIGSKDQPI